MFSLVLFDSSATEKSPWLVAIKLIDTLSVWRLLKIVSCETYKARSPKRRKLKANEKGIIRERIKAERTPKKIGLVNERRVRRKFTNIKAKAKSPKTPVVARISSTYDDENENGKLQNGYELKLGVMYLVKSCAKVPYPEPNNKFCTSRVDSWLIVANAI